jgi:hypothetical protein
MCVPRELSLTMLTMFVVLFCREVLAQAPPPSSVGVTSSCYIVFCESDTRKCLIFDEKGNWLRQVRLMQMAMKYPEKAYVALKMYEGIYEPSAPIVQKRWVTKIRAISTADFQKMIDDLNKGRDVDAGAPAPGDGSSSKLPKKDDKDKTENTA